MKEVAKLQIKDRTELFQATAISMGMQPNVIEKDFWVCFMLDHLFHDCRYKNAFVFKGGTSLSKSYHVIERFSEDIDLISDAKYINKLAFSLIDSYLANINDFVDGVPQEVGEMARIIFKKGYYSSLGKGCYRLSEKKDT